MKHHAMWLLLLLLSCQAGKQSAPYAHVGQIENGLLPAIVIKGEASPGMSMDDRMRHYRVPGVSMAIIDQGRIVWARGFGHHSFDSLRAVDEGSMFQAASISKPVAGMAALSLVEEGLLSLDEDVNSQLKSWQLPQNRFTADSVVSLRRLLTHSAGLTVHGFRGYAAGEAVPTTIQVLNGEKPANSAAIVADTFPGSLWRYSGGGYTVMQQMMCDATQQDFPSIMQQRVLDKIGMQHSTYVQPLPEALHAQAAIGHRADGQAVAGNWHTYPEMAAAGLWTTPSDLALYILEVQQSLAGKSNKVLSQEMTAHMLSKHLNDWGLGPALHGEGDSLSFGHGGANEGYRCIFFAFARKGQGVVIMTNGDRGSSLADEILRAVDRVYGWGRFTPEEKAAVQLTDHQLAEFAGTYRLNDQIQFEIRPADRQLLLHQLWDDVQLQLYAESDTAFFEPENGYELVFSRDESGRVQQFVANGRTVVERVE